MFYDYKEFHEPYDIGKNKDLPDLKPKFFDEEQKEADFNVISHENSYQNKAESPIEPKFEALNFKEPDFKKYESKDFEKRLTFGDFDSKASPQKIEQSKAFREKLPHQKEKNPLSIVESKITHNFMEDRVEKQDFSISQNDFKLDVENPNINLNSQNLQQTNFFSKHIFEDKIIMQVLQKKTMGKNFYEKEVIIENRELEKEKGDGKVVVRRAARDFDIYIKILHVVFKLLTVLFYVMLGKDKKSKNFMYQGVIFFMSIDFWVVKNIVARYLIEMRYWCEFDNKGREFWVFETINDRDVLPNRGNHIFFWLIQGFFAAAYTVITIYELVLLEYATSICHGYGAFLLILNFIIYQRCREIRRDQMEKYLNQMGELDRALYKVRGSVKLPIFIKQRQTTIS